MLAVVPLINLSTNQQHGNVLALITGNVDGSAHLAMFNDYLGFDTVQVWDGQVASRGKAEGFYPTSWHGANATVVQALQPALRPGAGSAAVFGFLNAFWISVLVFIVSRYAFTAYDLASKKRRRTTTYLTIPLLSLVTFYFFFVHLQRFGFFSFTPQLLATILLIYCFHQILQENVGRKSALGLAVIFCAVSLASWVLLLPVALGATFLTVLSSHFKKPIQKEFVLAELRSSWPLFALSLLSVMAQLWLMHSVSSASSVGVRTGLLLDGGAPVYNSLLYALLFAGLGSAVIYSRRIKQQLSLFYEPVFITSVVAILFASALFAYQVYYTSTTHYYYYKCIWLLTTVLAPIGIAMIAIFIDGIRNRLYAVLAALTIPALLIQFVPSDTGVLAFIRGSRTVSTAINQSVWIEMHRDTYPTNRVTIYFVNSGTNETSTISTLLIAANRPFNACYEELSDKIIYKSIDTALREIVSKPPSSVCKGKHIVLEVDPAYSSIVRRGNYSKDYTVHYLHV